MRVLRLARLHGDELRQLAWRRACVLVAVTWLPLFLFSALEGQAFGGNTRMSFLLDASIHVRFLLALPLLILAEIAVDARVRPTPVIFVERGLVPQRDMPRFREAIARALRLRDSWLAEVVILLLVYVLAVWQVGGGHFGRDEAALVAASWHTLPTGDGGRSIAGVWFAFVSLPLFQFLTLRWYYRILIWAGLTWRVSRLDLRLLPAHPDRAAGLGFLAQTVYAYLPLAVAHGTMLSAAIVNRIFYAGAVLTDFRLAMGVVIAFVFVLVLGPLLVFVPTLAAVNLKATAEYGALAAAAVRAFETRWIRDGDGKSEGLLDVGEVSAMADLDATVAIVREMHYVPITREGVLWIAVAVLAPLLPLLLTMMPADELLRTLMGIFI